VDSIKVIEFSALVIGHFKQSKEMCCWSGYRLKLFQFFILLVGHSILSNEGGCGHVAYSVCLDVRLL
jgi:hypothetical protein